MNEITFAQADAPIIPVTPQEVARARAFVGRQPDAADLLKAIGIGEHIQIITTDQTGPRP